MASDTQTTNGHHTPYDDAYFTIPKTCKAGVVVNEGPNFTMAVEMVPVPSPAPDEVLIRLNATGICASDIHFMESHPPIPAMSVFGVRSAGHEGAGVVVQVGSAVKNFKVGDRAGIKPLLDVCGTCELCWDDKEAYCPKGMLTGVMRTGSYQQYVTAPAKYTSPIPDGVSDVVAAPLMCSAATIYRSLKEAKLRTGDWAVFVGGGGGVGIQGVQLAKAMALRPIVVDTGASKREAAMRLGAEHFVDFKEIKDTVAEVVRIADGIGAHGVFVTAPGGYGQAVEFVGDRIGAKVMCVGFPASNEVKVSAPPAIIIRKNLTISGSLVGTMHDCHTVLQYAKRGALKQICEVYPIDKLPEAVDRLRRGEVAGRIVVDFNL